MADATYDVVVVGAGTKTLNLCLYLAKYGGLHCAMFERHDEAGGAMAGEENANPAFISPRHANIQGGDFYWETIFRDFPEEAKEYELDNGVAPKVAAGLIFGEDHKCLTTLHLEFDPTQEKSAAKIARFSQKDADTWLKLFSKGQKAVAAFKKVMFNPPSLGPNPIRDLWADPEMGLDPGWLSCSAVEIGKELFESPEMRIFWPLSGTSGGSDSYERGISSPPTARPILLNLKRLFPAGTIHHNAHALIKMNLALGNKIFTMSEAEKIIIEHGVAKGIRLADGTEIAAKKMVVTNVDPLTLGFKMIGKEYLPESVIRKLGRLERNYCVITWFQYALHDEPIYKAADWDPDVNDCVWLALGDRDEPLWHQRDLCRAMGHFPKDADGQPILSLHVGNNMPTGALPVGTIAPPGKCWRLTEQFLWPANYPGWDERRWLRFKKYHAEDEMRTWHQYAPNMSWDNVIGYDPETPWDIAQHMPNFGPEGNHHMIDACASQLGPFRPIYEWSQYAVPQVKNLYCTGTGWHPAGWAWSCEGYNCYKIIARDFALRKPWEELGAPY